MRFLFTLAAAAALRLKANTQATDGPTAGYILNQCDKNGDRLMNATEFENCFPKLLAANNITLTQSQKDYVVGQIIANAKIYRSQFVEAVESLGANATEAN